MLQRLEAAGLVALVWCLAMPVAARSQDDVPPVEFTGPLSHVPYDEEPSLFLIVDGVPLPRIRFPVWETSDWRFDFFALGTQVGFSSNHWLGSTPVGGFAACVDVLTTGPGVGLYWYPCEGVAQSFRLDLLRQRITASTIMAP